MKVLQMEKRNRLMQSALHLFMEQGIDETSVNDIAKAAKLAKGTFYVYFKDKETLINEVIMKNNILFINDMLEASYQESSQHDIAWSCSFLRHIMEYYQKNPTMLRMIQRFFVQEHSHAIFLQEVRSQFPHFNAFLESFRQESESEDAALARFVLMMGMTGVVCYHAIYLEQPSTIDVVGPIFYQNMCMSFARGKEKLS